METELKVGNPWTVLPIKNNKYARDLLEVHLSKRGLNKLEKFDNFPNLEEIWLNENKLINLDDISTNFRCKKVYCQNNMIENIHGLKKFKFLDTLLIGNNQLRDLDKFLVDITKFSFLKQLDLFGNPLAEEPDYRLKIIYLMPQVNVLDRHIVTVAERIKAKKICEEEYGLSQGSGPAAKQQDKVTAAPKKKGDGFSKGEKDLYREHAQIQKRFQAEKEAELERTRKFFETKTYTGIPTPTMKQLNKDNFGQNTEDKLVEWEKNQVKELFIKYDTDKTGITKENLVEIMHSLMEDECIIGKIPNLQDDEVEHVFDNWEFSEDGKVTWQQFRDGLNTWLWRMQDREVLQSMVDEFFALSLKYKMQGKDEECKEMATKALRLEGSLTKCKPIEISQKDDMSVSKRGDFLNIKKHRRQPQDPEALLPNDNYDDFTITHKF